MSNMNELFLFVFFVICSLPGVCSPLSTFSFPLLCITTAGQDRLYIKHTQTAVVWFSSCFAL